MKKSEFKKLIREELLKEQWASEARDRVEDAINDLLMSEGYHISSFEMLKNDGELDAGLYSSLDAAWSRYEKALTAYMTAAEKVNNSLD